MAIFGLTLVLAILAWRRHALDGESADTSDPQLIAALKRLGTACGISPDTSPSYRSLDHALRDNFLLDSISATSSASEESEQLNKDPDPKSRFLAIASPLYELLVRPVGESSEQSAFLLDQQFAREVEGMSSSSDVFRYVERHAEREREGREMLRRLCPSASKRSVESFRSLVRSAREAAVAAQEVVAAGELPTKPANALWILILTEELDHDAQAMPSPRLEWSFFVDDDVRAVETLKHWFCENPKTIALIGQSDDLPEALKALSRQKERIEHQMEADTRKSHSPALLALLQLAQAADQLMRADGEPAGEATDQKSAPRD